MTGIEDGIESGDSRQLKPGAHDPSPQEILDLVSREQLDILLAGAADRLQRPTRADDPDPLRARLKQLQATTHDRTSATSSSTENAQPWDASDELDDEATAEIHQAQDQW